MAVNFMNVSPKIMEFFKRELLDVSALQGTGHLSRDDVMYCSSYVKLNDDELTIVIDCLDEMDREKAMLLSGDTNSVANGLNLGGKVKVLKGPGAVPLHTVSTVSHNGNVITGNSVNTDEVVNTTNVIPLIAKDNNEKYDKSYQYAIDAWSNAA